MIKRFFSLLLIIILAGACNSTSKDVKVSVQSPTVTWAAYATITPELTSTQVPSGTPTIPMTPSLSPFPSPTFPPDCGSPKLGKPGTQQANDNNAPSVLIQGTAILCTNHLILTGDAVIEIDPEAVLDLDTGMADTERADVVFDVLGRMHFFSISNFNEAISQHWSLEVEGHQVQYPPQPTYDQCRELYRNPDQSDNEPAYLCVITNEGHVSRVKVEKFSPLDGVQSMEISFVTWSDVVVPP